MNVMDPSTVNANACVARTRARSAPLRALRRTRDASAKAASARVLALAARAHQLTRRALVLNMQVALQRQDAERQKQRADTQQRNRQPNRFPRRLCAGGPANGGRVSGLSGG